MKKFTTLFLTAALCSVFAIGPWPVASQGQRLPNVPVQTANAGKIINSYRKQQPGARPAWVDDALSRSLSHINQKRGVLGLVNAEAELALLSALQDDFGQTHVRLDQVFGGVPVFGGQLIAHLDVRDTRFVDGRTIEFTTGRVFPDARRVAPVPTITGPRAIELAKDALGLKGNFEREEVELVILPEAVKKSNEAPGATLTYKVELLINDGTTAAEPVYFVNAHNGRIEFYYDNLETGTGFSQYSGTVNIGTFFTGSLFEMNDRSRSDNRICPTRPGIITSDFSECVPFTDPDDVWGSGSSSSRQTAGVDAHYGATLTYDYFSSRHAWSGLDGSNHQLCNRTHNNGAGVDNAFWDGRCTNYGDGSQGRAWTAIDVVGHEFTHGMTQFSAGLQFMNQSGGENESFSDIFGTMVEFFSGINPDYLIAEDVNGAIRIMSNPRSDGRSIDHFSQYFDGIDPHFSSGLQNVAFYLLAESGTHPTSGVSVKRIGRDPAAKIYHRALTVYLFPTARFSDVRFACEQAARDFYSTGNPIYQATQRSWFSSGVGGDVPFNPIDVAQNFAAQQYRDFLLREPDGPGLDFWTGQITQCGVDAACEDGQRVNVSRAFWDSGEFQGRPDVQASGLLTPGTGRPYDNRQFVRWCYKNYLQREPDQGGWDFWTWQLNSHGDYNAIIKAFIVSFDYRGRFGPA